jgi:CRISP-associated protein Cas1
MRKMLNTLFVTTTGAYLCRDGENIVVKVDNNERFRIPVHNLEGIVSVGYMGASPGVMSLCCERKVALSFISEGGRFLARVAGAVSGNVLLRRKQFRLADDEKFCLNMSKLFIAGKVANCKTVLQRFTRDYPNSDDLASINQTIEKLSVKQNSILRAKGLNELRGTEGEAACAYFSVLDHLVLHHKESFFMHGRNRRPPTDNLNALLSFVYTLLMHEVRTAIECVGLDPCVGYLHTDRPGRPSLALDLMEEFRPFIADRLVLSLINRKQVTAKGFLQQPSGGVIMDDLTRKEVITAWQKRKQEELMHPFLNERIPVGLLPYCQALLMARFLRGDLDNYPVFINK